MGDAIDDFLCVDGVIAVDEFDYFVVFAGDALNKLIRCSG